MHAETMRNSPSVIERYATRLRSGLLPGIAFALLGALTGASGRFPHWMLEPQGQGIGAALYEWVMHIALPGFVAALVIVLSVRISIENTTAMRRRPAYFLLVVVLASGAATFAARVLAVVLTEPDSFGWLTTSMAEWLDIGMSVLLWGLLFAWLYLQHLQRAEDKAHLVLLLTRRSALVRQLAHSRLLTVRAQIDPELVAGILSAVRARHAQDADAAALLLEHLISYLRLAMNRRREQLTMSDETALIRAYLALRGAETGVGLTLTVDEETRQTDATLPPLFPSARKLIDAALPEAGDNITLRIAMPAHRLLIEMTTGGHALNSASWSRLSTDIRELLGEQAPPPMHSCVAEVNRYVVCVE